MSMRILKVGDANARFAQHEQRIIEECEELSNAVCEAIEGVDIDTKNRWTLNGFSTCRVAYVDASSYLPETIAAVALAFEREGYLVNPMVMEVGNDDPDMSPTMTMLAILWDPDAILGICHGLEEADLQPPAVTETLHGEGDAGASETDGAGASPADGDAEGTGQSAEHLRDPDPVSEEDGASTGFPV